jgi:TM2 domain-containing membrane protein YozV
MSEQKTEKQIDSFLDDCMSSQKPEIVYRDRPQIIIQQAPPQRRWRKGTAGLLSLVIPGAGQIYKGQPINGLVWLAFTVFMYGFLIPVGLLAHLFCIVGASSGDEFK